MRKENAINAKKERWYVVRNGEILFCGTEKQCGRIVAKDEVGWLEMYPESARIKDSEKVLGR